MDSRDVEGVTVVTVARGKTNSLLLDSVKAKWDFIFRIVGCSVHM